jgi:hypothetical protein
VSSFTAPFIPFDALCTRAGTHRWLPKRATKPFTIHKFLRGFFKNLEKNLKANLSFQWLSNADWSFNAIAIPNQWRLREI